MVRSGGAGRGSVARRRAGAPRARAAVGSWAPVLAPQAAEWAPRQRNVARAARQAGAPGRLRLGLGLGLERLPSSNGAPGGEMTGARRRRQGRRRRSSKAPPRGEAAAKRRPHTRGQSPKIPRRHRHIGDGRTGPRQERQIAVSLPPAHMVILRIVAASFTNRVLVRNPATATVTSFRTRPQKHPMAYQNAGDRRGDRGGIDFDGQCRSARAANSLARAELAGRAYPKSLPAGPISHGFIHRVYPQGLSTGGTHGAYPAVLAARRSPSVAHPPSLRCSLGPPGPHCSH
jgi:hypothetical protein